MYKFSNTIFRRYGRDNVETVLKRDKCCINCGSKERLCIHHKDGFGLNRYSSRGFTRKEVISKMNNSPKNLELLCLSCHAKVHKFWFKSYKFIKKGKGIVKKKNRTIKKIKYYQVWNYDKLCYDVFTIRCVR